MHKQLNFSRIGRGITKRYLRWLPDEAYLRLLYYFTIGKRLRLKNPQTFTEKIQWLKLYNRKPEFTMMVDKYAVKDYVAGIIGSEYVIPTLGVWDSFDEIDFDSLPDKFVLKTTHGGGSGGVVICRDKALIDKEAMRRKLEKSLKQDIYKSLREWPYKNVARRIIAEQFLEIDANFEIKDYKFFCFNGEPRFLKVDFNRFIEHHANYYDTNWQLLPFGEAGLLPVESHIEQKPENFEEMVEIARKLSKGQPFLRVDLYNLQGKIYFGELTFFPASGLGAFSPMSADSQIGDYIKLSI